MWQPGGAERQGGLTWGSKAKVKSQLGEAKPAAAPACIAHQHALTAPGGTGAPATNSCSTQPAWPPAAAAASGVRPCCSVPCTLAPPFSRMARQVSEPASAAAYTGVQPSLFEMSRPAKQRSAGLVCLAFSAAIHAGELLVRVHLA